MVCAAEHETAANDRVARSRKMISMVKDAAEDFTLSSPDEVNFT